LAQHSDYLNHSSDVWPSIHIPAVAVSKKPHLVEDILYNATYCMAKCVHSNSVCKIKSTAFLYQPGMDSTNVKNMACSILDSHSVQLIKHVNEISFLHKLSSGSVTYQLSHTKIRN